MFADVEKGLMWFEDRNIFTQTLLGVLVFIGTIIAMIMWFPTTVGGLMALALFSFQGYLAWKGDRVLFFASLALFLLSWLFYLIGSYNAASVLGFTGLGIFASASLRGPSFLDRLKWPESKVLLRPPF